jgi:hypothetical protein
MKEDKDLFAIFRDLPWPRPSSPPAHQYPPTVEHPHPPATHVTSRRVPANRETPSRLAARVDDAALRRIREIAETEYARLTSNSHLARSLRTIIAIADAAIAQ